MKVAILQDWLLVNGGAEKVLRSICRIYPNADIFALIDRLSDDDRADILQGRRATTSFLNRIPGIEKSYRKLLPIYPWAVRQLDLSGYDLIISSSYSVIKNVKKRPGQVHICYCHSPMRYAYDLRSEYLKTLPFILRPLAKMVLSWIGRWDRKRSSNVDVFIANSIYVKDRIKRIYNRDSAVIYPPVSIDKWKVEERIDGGYYVTASRLVAYKNVDVIIDAFKENQSRNLIVLGDGPMFEKWQQEAPSNVTFKGHIPREQQICIIQKASGLIVAADEDFGITPVEAQAAGVPVIAYRKGGYLETVTEGETGLFFDRLTGNDINRALDQLNDTIPLDPHKAEENARRFSEDRFKTEFLTLVEEKINS
jgi:glycosyltransferase involved in cell wall biosynthesis